MRHGPKGGCGTTKVGNRGGGNGGNGVGGRGFYKAWGRMSPALMAMATGGVGLGMMAMRARGSVRRGNGDGDETTMMVMGEWRMAHGVASALS